MDGEKLRRLQAGFAKHMRKIDELSMVVLKGHLLIEESLDRIISGFVFHAEQLDLTRFTFAQRVCIARSISLDEHENSMWQLVLAVNSLRNDLAHALDSDKRASKMRKIRDLFAAESKGQDEEHGDGDDHIVVAAAVALCIGFLSSFEAEVERFRDWVGKIDRIVNPHRHSN